MITGVSLGHADVVQAERWIRSLQPAPVHACTHLLQEPYPHVAISVDLPDGAPAPVSEPALRGAAAAAAAAHTRSGRAVRYPGVEHLVGVLAVGDLLAVSAIEEIAVLGGGAADAADEIDTRDFVRPQWIDGVLTLVVTPAGDGRWVPFEVADPTPCCGGPH